MHRLTVLLVGIVCWLHSSGTLVVAAESGPNATRGEPRPFVAPLFGERMVLQRNQPNTFWGWTRPGAVVVVRMGSREGRGVADGVGKWRASIVPPTEPGEYTVWVDGPSQAELKHVVVGSIWVCVGPPTTRDGRSPDEETGAPTDPVDPAKIRFFVVDPSAESGHRPHWIECPARNRLGASGVSEAAYALACLAQKETGQVVGIVQDLMGNLPVEDWLGPTSDSAKRASARRWICRLATASLESTK